MTNTVADIADRADMIVDGYAFTQRGDLIQVVNLHNLQEALVFDQKDRIVETTMSDIGISIVSALYQKNKQYLHL